MDQESGTTSNRDAGSTTSLEGEHVTRVYNHIAKHFSDTRHTPWPKVRSFLLSLDVGSLVYDVGCGNGKYSIVNPSIHLLGVDSSIELLLICRQKGLPVVLSDAKSLPFRSDSADNVISIAVLHHLSSPADRSLAVREISRVLRPGGSALLSVWALEQNRNGSGSKYISGRSKNPLSSTLDSRTEAGAAAAAAASATELHSCNESLASCASPVAASEKVSSFEGLPIHRNRTPFQQQDVLVPWTCKQTGERLLRYYHVFVQDELSSLCQGVPGIRVTDQFYDDGNWCVVIQKEEAVSRDQD